MKKHWKSGFILCLAIPLGLSLSHPTPTHASVIMQDNTQTDVKVDAQSSKTIKMMRINRPLQLHNKLRINKSIVNS